MGRKKYPRQIVNLDGKKIVEYYEPEDPRNNPTVVENVILMGFRIDGYSVVTYQGDSFWVKVETHRTNDGITTVYDLTRTDSPKGYQNVS